MKPAGTLYGIGVGPGDPELISVKGLKILQSVPVVAFPAGVGDRIGMAERIVADWLQERQVKLPLTFPYVRNESILAAAWQQAAREVGEVLQSGRDVAFVSEGDVSFYSTFTYLSEALKRQHPHLEIRTIPGICSPLAAAAELGIPLTIAGQRLAVLPALYAVEELERALDWADAVVLMKMSSVYPQVWQVLQRRGLLDRTYVVERATWPEATVYRGLRDRDNLQLPYFSLTIIQVRPAEVPTTDSGTFSATDRSVK
ncbi:precorrin-2 C(20)-methyltransferase [Oxynema sp. CENA135]|uniref:precorrin-2 C(20)-methyltransferase n=1 Tax=Oxynema sp. CENA135 TaxID=984206 RepID=UPI00190D8366|nr:precorrin-2 C(20)-methyltransferase [Oxynema sp. CENA135]MBK4729353.1 precorrin-2 C(20)-methyltransferase [Oxynema sp. CENA135]